MIVGRPDNVVGNAAYPVGKVSTGIIAAVVDKVGRLINSGLVNLSLIKHRLIG